MVSERLNTKISDAMHRIEELYYETDGKCYMAFSGGKDSTVLLALVKMCEEIYTIPQNAIAAVFSDTGIELDATKEFVEWCKKNYYQNIQIIRPKKPFALVLKEKGKPMKSKMRSDMINRYHRLKQQEPIEEFMQRPVYRQLIYKFNPDGSPNRYTAIADKDLHLLHDDFDIIASSECCNYLKKKPFERYVKENKLKGYMTGIRSSEGGARTFQANIRQIRGGKICTVVKNNVILKMPIIDWSDEDIEEFIEEYNVPLSRAYTEYGMERTGCMGCPYSMDIKYNLETLYKYEPNKYKASMFFLKDVYIAQNVKLPFDKEYEEERLKIWDEKYHKMRFEMIDKYRQGGSLHKRYTSGKIDYKK